jgi:kinesin family protein 2/24
MGNCLRCKSRKEKDEDELHKVGKGNVVKVHMKLDDENPYYDFKSMINKYSGSTVFKRMSRAESMKEHPVSVCIRKRPFNESETATNEVDIISVPTNYEIVVHAEKNDLLLTKYVENQHFRFDYAFDEKCQNEFVYKQTAKPLVGNVFDGGMSTCIAYGEAASGKTHTMAGRTTPVLEKGLYVMTAEDVFKFKKIRKFKRLNLVISASFFEIYCGEIYDLLANSGKLRIREDRYNQMQIEGLTERVVKSLKELLEVIEMGNAARTSDEASENYRASRSHAIFQIILRSSGVRRIHGKFSLIDLAGNERGPDTVYPSHETKIEGSEINKSLLFLRECIRAMGKGSTRVPFRGNKLTQILRDCFIGKKPKACVIAMINPGLSSYDYSLDTLRFANKIK